MNAPEPRILPSGAKRLPAAGQAPSLRLNTYFLVSRRSFNSGGTRPESATSQSSSSGTRTSTDAAMLILSV